MQIKRLVTFLCIAAIMATPLLIATKSSNNQLFLQQAFADHMKTATSNEKTVLHRGIATSEPISEHTDIIRPRANEQAQAYIVLPFRNDGSTYRGILTYTATKPVEVSLPHVIPIDNVTLSQLDKQKFGKVFVRELTNQPGKVSATGRIMPDYSGSTSPYFSASIPFVASSVLLRTSGEPFIVAYEVSADILQPKIIKHHENATISSIATNSTS